MKRILFVFAVICSITACKEDNGTDPGENTGYPTDGLTLEKSKKSMLIMNYDMTSQATISFEIIRKLNEEMFGDNLNHVSFVSNPGMPLHSPVADTLMNFFGVDISMAPSFVLETKEVMLNEVSEAVEMSINEKPFMAVAHKVSENDTAWVIDNKVKIFKDTATFAIFIDTYMLVNIDAKKYDTLDLRMPELKDFTKNTDNTSMWAIQIPNADTSAYVTQVGEQYVHPYIFVDNYSENPFGEKLSDINPFGFQYQENDVLGTRYTPIRHYFLKEDYKMLDKKGIRPQFLSVVWFLDPFTGNYNYINSYMSSELK